MNSIADIPDLAGQKVMLRVDANVPYGDNGIIDEHEAWRIQSFLPTLDHLLAQGAAVTIIAHHGKDGADSLEPLSDYLTIRNYTTELIGKIDELGQSHDSGTVRIFENIRRYNEEKKNEPDFVEQLAGYFDMYINEAFSVSHRSHASIVGIAQALPSYAGLHLQQEIEQLRAVREASNPLIVIGGAKFGTKLPLIERFLEAGATVMIGGALAHSVYTARGLSVGESLVDESVDVSAWARHPNIIVAGRVIIERNETEHEIAIGDILAADRIVDVGPDFSAKLTEFIAGHEVVLWNGPMGWYEGGYTAGTRSLASGMAASDAKVIVGGGDTVAVLMDMQLVDDFSFVSTGGGALLDYLLDGSLVGIDALGQ